MNNLILIFLLGLIIIAILIGVFIIYLLRFWHLRGLKNDEKFNEIIKKDSEQLYKIMAENPGVALNNNESLGEYETLLRFVNYGDHSFKKESDIYKKVKNLKVIVYFDFLIDEEAELPTVIIGTKFLDEKDEILFDLLIDEYGDGCIKSGIANKERKNKIMIAISFAEYYLTEYTRLNKDLKVTKTIRTALPISGLNNIEGYSLELI